MNSLERYAILVKLHTAQEAGLHGEAKQIIQELCRDLSSEKSDNVK